MKRVTESLASRVSFARKKRGLSQDELALASGMKQPDISKIENGRMLKTTGIARLAAALRVSAAWLEIGAGDAPIWAEPHDQRAGLTSLAQPMGDWSPIIYPQTLTRGEWMDAATLPQAFQIELVDDALGTRFPKGGMMCFVTTDEPTPGDPVLLVDGAGNRSVRYYMVRGGASWVATAADGSGYQPFDSERDSLQVLAVYYGYFKRRKGA